LDKTAARAQHFAQTPSPATGSRQATHKVGSAMSRTVRAAYPIAPWHDRNTPRRVPDTERDDDASAAMGEG
jgi:hypothetical protein